jgi:GNAT superfamily N-acetyltransferase
MGEDQIDIASGRERPIAARGVRRLYDGAGWWPGWPPESIERAIAASVTVGAWDGDRLVGFTRAISDGVHRAYIEDVVVDPDYRGHHIGEQIVAALVALLGDVHIVSLFCEPERVNFYSRNGFRSSSTQVMMHRESATRDHPPGALDREV